MSSANVRLTQMCDEAIARLERAVELLRGIKAQDGASANATAWLRGMCRSVPYEGDVLCVSMESVFTQLEEMEADEAFGPQEEQTAAS